MPVNGAAEVFFENKSVVKNSSIHISVLNERHNAICYNRVIEYQAEGVIYVGWITGDFNVPCLF